MTESASSGLNQALAEQRAKTNPQAVEVITEANKKLDESGIIRGLEVGDKAPDFTLPNPFGSPVSLSQRLEEGPAVVTFYRGEWCPYCNLTLRALQAELPRIHGMGASLIAISPQAPDDALTMKDKNELEFDVLSDVEQEVIQEYGLQFRVPSEIEEVHMTVFKKDISELNADGSWNLPAPGTFVIDQQGVVRARYVGADYTKRMEPAEVVRALEEVQGEKDAE